LHGMAQRGGAVQSSVIVDYGISPVIPSGRADCVLGFEPVETVRALPFVSSRTVVYMNTAPVVPFIIGQQSVLQGKEAKYPDVGTLAEAVRAVTPHIFTFDATQRAAEAGSARALNMVMLGCLFGAEILPCTAGAFWGTAVARMPPAMSETNGKAFLHGVELGKALQLAEGRP